MRASSTPRRLDFAASSLEYRIARRSLSSGRPKAGPVGWRRRPRGGARIHQTCLCHLAALSARAVQEKRPSKIRGRGECRVPNAPAASCALCSRSMHTSIHSGGTGNIRHSPRNGFTAYIALSPGTGLFCPRHFRGIVSHETLAPASGRQDHTTSPSASSAARLASPKRPPHPAPRS